MLHQNDEASTLKHIANHVRVYIQENCDGSSCLHLSKQANMSLMGMSEKPMAVSKGKSWKDKQQL